MSFTKAEYLEWRKHPVHDVFLAEVLEMIDTDIASLVNNAGENPMRDRLLVGRIKGLQELVDWKPTIEDDEPNES